ncbi:MAG: ABC transporter ATP-binding protein [Verrucomicrobiia bacterium]
MLKLIHLRAGYGPIDVLKDIHLEVKQNEIVTLIGANGAGKSTTLLTITGMLPLRQGQILWHDQPLDKLASHEIVQHGICLAPEGRHIFPRLTVEENLLIGSYQKSKKRDAKKLEKIFNYFPLLKERYHQLGGTLSGGEQQMLAIGRALMGEPQLLMLDEPSLGLAPLIVEKIFQIIQEINQAGVSVLLIEQNANQALKIAHRGYVLANGQSLKWFWPRALHCEEVRQAYLT